MRKALAVLLTIVVLLGISALYAAIPFLIYTYVVAVVFGTPVISFLNFWLLLFMIKMIVELFKVRTI
jgi:hypothetical protein